MATYIFQKLTQTAASSGINLNSTPEAQQWYRDSASSLISKNVNFARLTKGSADRFLNSRSLNPTAIGKMLLFNYDPKHKLTLPYYDIFPLVFPVELYDDGFLGLNMHYLPHYYRASLMDGLYSAINNQLKNDTTRIKLSYQILNSASKFKLFTPCLKRYLYAHVKSRYFIVDVNEWDMTLMLPLQRFVGAKADKVYSESLRKVR